jgi:hypothetical protein
MTHILFLDLALRFAVDEILRKPYREGLAAQTFGGVKPSELGHRPGGYSGLLAQFERGEFLVSPVMLGRERPLGELP